MSAPDARLIDPDRQDADAPDASLRPQRLADFTGQKSACANLSVFVEAVKSRGDVLDHVLFYGPPGLGKTTLAHIVSRELGVGFRATSGPILTKAADLAAILTNLQAGDVLFIDEIHRLGAAVEEVLYPAMEDFHLDILIGDGPSARSIRIDLPKFTLIGATTRLGLLSNPLRDRFGIPLRLTFYEIDELKAVIVRGAAILGLALSEEGAEEIARRARGTPRVAVRLLRRVRDFAHVAKIAEVDAAFADQALSRLDVDALGLDAGDRRYLRYVAEHYDGGPVGVETIAAGLSEQRDVLEETIEPFLMQLGMVHRTPRGRVLSPRAFAHLGLAPPNRAEPLPLLEDE